MSRAEELREQVIDAMSWAETFDDGRMGPHMASDILDRYVAEVVRETRETAYYLGYRQAEEGYDMDESESPAHAAFTVDPFITVDDEPDEKPAPGQLSVTAHCATCGEPPFHHLITCPRVDDPPPRPQEAS